MKKVLSGFAFILIGVGIGIGIYSYINKPITSFSVYTPEQKQKNNRTIEYCVKRFPTIASFREIYNLKDYPDRSRHLLVLPHGGILASLSSKSDLVELQEGNKVTYYHTQTDPNSASMTQIEKAIEANNKKNKN
ncbi:hypothetical protein [Lactococcus allomyrinae]|uniref:Uncharacterized protein n=1 Tax=Lactococcus allomyrinae TaxID=2419773 RepID=A0A387BH00_9LACT|nr:hypothetical protein [Lactococcus allomyrinae]AYG01442.1 hypothetical protein D7I46_10395 [Lactococcus allomyrinae]